MTTAPTKGQKLAADITLSVIGLALIYWASPDIWTAVKLYWGCIFVVIGGKR